MPKQKNKLVFVGYVESRGDYADGGWLKFTRWLHNLAGRQILHIPTPIYREPEFNSIKVRVTIEVVQRRKTKEAK